MPLIPFDDIRNLPLPNLGLRLLGAVGAEQATFNSVVQGFRNQPFGEPQPLDIEALLARLSDAWAWLEAHALIGPSALNPPTADAHRRTAMGQQVLDDSNAIAKVWAADRLSGPLDPALASALSVFALGDYEVASFAAMKAVEVEVRRLAGFPDSLIGVGLMRKAFSPEDGALRDGDVQRGEQQATADLFAGAIGAFKNPASHRTVRFEDPLEAAEVIQLADLLLRIVRRAELRRS